MLTVQKVITLLTLSTLCSFALANTSIKNSDNFCSKNNIKKEIQNPLNRLSFRNSGGLLNAGVCWWHSEFTRNANALVYFSPEKNRPTDSYNYKWVRRTNGKGRIRKKIPAPGSLKDILVKIKKGDSVVEIPGFSNLYEFSKYYEKEIQALLEGWQIEDGVIKQKWITGLSGSTSISSTELEKRMHQTYQRVQNGEIVYQMLQIDGVDAHSWLVVNMEKFDRGYRLDVVDSNDSVVRNYFYIFGQTNLNHRFYGDFVPYTQNVKEWDKLIETKNIYCLDKAFNMNKSKSDHRDIETSNNRSNYKESHFSNLFKKMLSKSTKE